MGRHPLRLDGHRVHAGDLTRQRADGGPVDHSAAHFPAFDDHVVDGGHEVISMERAANGIYLGRTKWILVAERRKRPVDLISRRALAPGLYENRPLARNG